MKDLLNEVGIELIIGTAGLVVASFGVLMKIFWDRIKGFAMEISRQEDRLLRVEEFIQKSFDELKELHTRNIAATTESSNNLKIAITKINTTLEYVIKRQDKQESDIDNIKSKKE